MFTVALSTTTKTSKQPENNCPSTEEQIELYMHTMDHYSAHKKEWNNDTCSNICAPRDYNTKSVKDKYYVIPLIRRMPNMI